MHGAAPKTPGRPRDPGVTEAIIGATLRLLAEEGFAHLTMDAVAKAAGVGKPAVYRRFADKADLVAKVFATELPVVEAPDLGDTRAELEVLSRALTPSDPGRWIGFLGGLFAEHRRHPEVVEAFRRGVLLPRRAAGRRMVERGQARGELRADVDPELLLDFFAGPAIAHALAGGQVDDDWRERALGLWWELAKAPGAPGPRR